MTSHPRQSESLDRLKRQHLDERLLELEAERDRYKAALEHIAQAVGAKANGTDAKFMARHAREALDREP